VLDSTLPAPVRTEKGRKTFAKIFYWALLIGGVTGFQKPGQPPGLRAEVVLFLSFSILFIVLLLLMPKIVSLLHRVGRTILFKSEQSVVRNNPITRCQLPAQRRADTLKRVKEKISHVDGVRIDMIQSGTLAQKTAEDKL